MTIEGRILEGIVGSTAYGLAHEGSDVDYLGCYVAPSVAFFGFNPPDQSAVTKNPDCQYHELGKYLQLLLNCNPTVMELLWLPKDLYTVCEDIGRELIAMRSYFLSARRVKDAYLGYATSQFKRLSERGNGTFSADTSKRTAKHARHLMRLCHQGFTLYKTGELPIRLEDPEKFREFGESVANDPLHGSFLATQLITEYEKLFDMTVSALPTSPKRVETEDWLVDVRKRLYVP